MNTELLHQYINDQNWSMHGIVHINEILPVLKEHQAIFEDWIDKGGHADMSYLPKMKEDRYHPQNKLEDIQSVIVLGAWYDSSRYPIEGSIEDLIGRGLVARYAAGKDYHKVLKKKLIQLSRFLELNFEGGKTYASVDSGPTVDRVLAEVAGLGFFGKNCCLINPSKGSYFFIAVLYTNLNLSATPKKTMPNCGNCTNCLDACPTGALVGPGQIDAGKCISYLTIENREGIPLELRSKIGNRLFGCDICQEVCPFNIGRAHRQEVKIENLKADYGAGGSLDLTEILSIKTDEEYLQKFAGTPLMRAKRRGLIRNACVVAGNSGNKNLIPYLQQVIYREEDEMLKEHAKWGIDQIKGL